MIDPKLAAKRAEAEAAKQRLLATAHELQARLRPDAIAERAGERMRLTAERTADNAVAAVRRRPVAAGAAAAGAVALLAAGPIVRLVRRRRDKDAADD